MMRDPSSAIAIGSNKDVFDHFENDPALMGGAGEVTETLNGAMVFIIILIPGKALSIFLRAAPAALN